MQLCKGATVVLLCTLTVLADGKPKPKRDNVPAVFQNAHFIYVQSDDGDALTPGVYPDDRQAIFDVQEKIRDWKRYVITFERENADLVFMVRKGRVAAARLHGGVSVGTRTPPVPNPGQAGGQNPGQATSAPGAEVGAGGEIGPGEDLLRVYIPKPDGKLIGPVWTRELDGGLDGPAVVLVEQLKEAVERSYPPTPEKKDASQSQDDKQAPDNTPAADSNKPADTQPQDKQPKDKPADSSQPHL
jgi:hypothetical protein